MTGPIIADINPEGIGFKKYRCKKCGKIFKAAGKSPECPECRSMEMEFL